MTHDKLLDDIWLGNVQPARGAAAMKLSRQLRALVPVHHINLTARHHVDRVAVMLDDAEMLPALPLGDVLAEELSLDVPYGSLVVLREAGSSGDVSHDAGLLVGEILLMILRSGLFPMHRETDALYAVARSYDRLAEASGFRHVGLTAREFRTGLAASLGAYWSGARSARAETSGLFDRPDFLRRPELLQYLRALDASFSVEGPDAMPARLMLFTSGAQPFEAWLQKVGQVVAPAIGVKPKDTLPKMGNIIPE
jgi:hypothetical protein